jgi:SSS family solute:Na+ symporter
MSNASGSLNSLASSSMMDLRTPFRSSAPANVGSEVAEAASPQVSLRRSRQMTLVWGAVLVGLGLVKWGPVLVAGLTIASITYGGLLGVFLLGTWNRRASESGALVGFVAGIASVIAIHRYTPLAWTWYVVAGTLITFAVGSLASVATRNRGNHPAKANSAGGI